MTFSTITLIRGEREIQFCFRGDSVGDNGVITQIFQQNDYQVEQWSQGRCLHAFYSDIVILGKRPLIIDAGANIGASPLWFSLAYPEAFIFSIEPERNNFELLQLNTATIEHKMNFLGAISGEEGFVTVHSSGFSDWAFQTKKVTAEDSGHTDAVKAISPGSILSLAEKEDCVPFIFKIDIEGAEAELFTKASEWLSQFPLVAIELHDWMFPFSGSSKTFLQAIASHEFDLVHRGENIFCFNRTLLRRYQG